jgi:hypothetical protein
MILYVNLSDSTCGGNSPCYVSIQASVNAATNGAHIRISAGNYDETPSLNQSKTVTLSGSWNASFTSQTSNSSRIRSLRVTQGTLHVKEM